VPNGSPQDLVERLEAAVAVDASALPALAEALRREGRPAEAERAARQGLERKPGCAAAGLALGLALLDQGRIEEARRELEQAAGEALAAYGAGEAASSAAEAFSPPDVAGGFGGELTDQELERAFGDAEADRDQILDAYDIAEQAIRQVELAPQDEIAHPGNGTFETHTMADLLERQGDACGAERIRTALAASAAPDSDRRQRIIATLEGWLENLEKGRED
jgi:tetratricopeptide (TPR) repeat protein